MGALLLFAVSPAVAFADNGPLEEPKPHDGSVRVLPRVHTSPDSSGFLLKVDESQLCYSCHGGVGAGATTNVQFGYAKDGVRNSRGG